MVKGRKNRKNLKNMLNYREELYNKYIEFCRVCSKRTRIHYLLFSEIRLEMVFTTRYT